MPKLNKTRNGNNLFKSNSSQPCPIGGNAVGVSSIGGVTGTCTTGKNVFDYNQRSGTFEEDAPVKESRERSVVEEVGEDDLQDTKKQLVWDHLEFGAYGSFADKHFRQQSSLLVESLGKLPECEVLLEEEEEDSAQPTR